MLTRWMKVVCASRSPLGLAGPVAVSRSQGIASVVGRRHPFLHLRRPFHRAAVRRRQIGPATWLMISCRCRRPGWPPDGRTSTPASGGALVDLHAGGDLADDERGPTQADHRVSRRVPRAGQWRASSFVVEHRKPRRPTRLPTVAAWVGHATTTAPVAPPTRTRCDSCSCPRGVPLGSRLLGLLPGQSPYPPSTARLPATGSVGQ